MDDGSTDGSGAILDEYREKVEKRGGGGQRMGKFVVIHQPNRGVSAARNAALDVAQGEWIGFLDGDDMFRPDALEHLHQVITENSCDGVLFQPYMEYLKREDVVPTDRFEVIAKMRNGVHLMTDEISANGFPFGRFYRRTVFGQLRFLEGLGMCEDVRFWCDAIGVGAAWIAVRGSYYFYRQREGSACTCHDFARYSQIIDVNLYVANRLITLGGVDTYIAYWDRYRWSCEQVKDAFVRWGDYTKDQKEKLLSYKSKIEQLAMGMPYSLDFRLTFLLHRANLHCLYRPTMFALRVVRAIKRRIKGCQSEDLNDWV